MMGRPAYAGSSVSGGLTCPPMEPRPPDVVHLRGADRLATWTTTADCHGRHRLPPEEPPTASMYGLPLSPSVAMPAALLRDLLSDDASSATMKRAAPTRHGPR